MRHYWLRASSEEREQVVDQAALCGVARDGCRENVKVTDLSDALHDILGFEPVHSGLDRRISRLAFFGEGILNLANRRFTASPQCFHDLELELGKFRRRHVVLLCLYEYLLHLYVIVKQKFKRPEF